MKTEQKFYRQQVDIKLKDSLKAVAASRHITTRELATQVLSRFIEARAELLTDLAKNNDETDTRANEVG